MALYQESQRLLGLRIPTGEYCPGMKIPSEIELCRELAVSRVTVREALPDLVRGGMLVNSGSDQSRHDRVLYPATRSRRLARAALNSDTADWYQ